MEIDELAKAAAAAGDSMALLTLTVRHKATDKLKDLIPFLRGACGALLTGPWWSKPLVRLGGLSRAQYYCYVGLVRIIEVTHGLAGWHPHVHALVVFDGDLPDGLLDELRAELAARWAAHVKKHMGRTVSAERGLDLRAWSQEEADTNGPGGYLTKLARGWGAGSELAAGHAKQSGGMNAAQLIEAYTLAEGPERARLGRLVVEYVEATKNVRQSFTSRGLRARYGLDAEATDEQLAEEQEDLDGETVATLDPEVFHWARKLGADEAILRGAEQHGYQGVLAALHNHGLPVYDAGNQLLKFRAASTHVLDRRSVRVRGSLPRRTISSQ